MSFVDIIIRLLIEGCPGMGWEDEARGNFWILWRQCKDTRWTKEVDGAPFIGYERLRQQGGDPDKQLPRDLKSRFRSALNCSIKKNLIEKVAEYKRPARSLVPTYHVYRLNNMASGSGGVATSNPPDGRLHVVTPVTPTLAAGGWLTGGTSAFFSAVDTRAPSSPHDGISPMDREESIFISPEMLNELFHNDPEQTSDPMMDYEEESMDIPPENSGEIYSANGRDAQPCREEMQSSIAENPTTLTSPIPDIQHFQHILSYLEDGDITTGESARPPIFHPPVINGWDMEDMDERIEDIVEMIQEDNARPRVNKVEFGQPQETFIYDCEPSFYETELDPSPESPNSFTMSPGLFNDFAHTDNY